MKAKIGKKRAARFYARVITRPKLCLHAGRVLGLIIAAVLELTVSRKVDAQAPTFEWARLAGGPMEDFGRAVAADAVGNIYVAGYFIGQATFGTNILGSAADSSERAFIAKLDSFGDYLWVRAASLASSSYSRGLAVASDAAGNAYAAGYFYGSIFFGSNRLASANGDLFLVKYSSNGAVAWAKQVASSSQTYFADGSLGVGVASDGSVHLTAAFGGILSAGTNTLTSSGGFDVLHLSYDTDGGLTWARKAGGLNQDYGYSVTVDSAGSSYVVGRIGAPANFGGVALPGHPLTPNYDVPSVFVVKYDPVGEVIWAKQLTAGNDAGSAKSVALAPDGGCFVTGSIYRSVLGTSDGFRIFVARIGSDGLTAWIRYVSSTATYSPEASAIAGDSAGNAVVFGSFSGQFQIGASNLTSVGGTDLFVTKYNSQGSVVWVRQAGQVFDDYSSGIVTDPNGNVYFTGWFRDTTRFDSTLLSGNANEIFVAKLPAIAPVPPTITSQPQNQMTPSGSNVTLVVNAAGTPTLSYQWRFNGTKLLNQTNATLTINNAQLANEGPYRVVVSNTGGSVTSAVATLTIVFPPSISSQPQSQIVTAGTEVNFSIATTGTLPLSYRWQFNGTNIAEGTNAVLVISNAQPADGGSYTVVVTNGYGAVTSSVATLTVRYSLTVDIMGGGTVTRNPAFTNYPPNLTVTLTPAPSASFVFNFWSGDASGNSSPLSIAMTTNKTITAHFASTAVTLAIQGDGTASKSPDRAFYNIGEQVTLTATPGRWFGFSRWSDGPTVNPRVITIGANNSYTAMFSPTTAVETLTFSNVLRTAPVGMPAIFVDGEFVVTKELSRLDSAEASMLTTFPNGSIFYTLDGSAPSFAANLYGGPFVLRRSATVRAVAYDASFLNSWEADPVHVIIEPTFVVNATTAGGGTVGVSPGGASYRSNTLVTLSATPAPGWTFLQWLGDASGTSAATSVRVMNRDLCAQALFGTTLGTTVAGSGSVVVDPAAVLYPYGTVARLTAVPQAGHYFGAWGNAVMSTNNPLLFPVTNAAPTVSCAFGPLSAGQVALTVLVTGRGRVTTNPRGNRFASNQSVTLTATADVDQDFLGWTGDATGTTTNLAVALVQSKIITANFTRRPRLSLGPSLGGWREEGFQMTLTGEFGMQYRIEQSGGLTNWSTLANFTNAYGIWKMIDTAATNDVTRFYRVVEEP